MLKISKVSVLIFSLVLLVSCSKEILKGTYCCDLDFLKQYQEVVVLSENNEKSQLIVFSKLQGRVTTSTAKGLEGNSYGWMHYDLIASGKFEEHYNPLGG